MPRLLAVLAVAFAAAQLTGGDRSAVRRLTVHNPTPYTVNVDVTGADRDGWRDLGAFARESERTVEELKDPGDTWVFRFSYGGLDAGELEVTTDQLDADGWTFTVPAEVGQRLRQAGVEESRR